MFATVACVAACAKIEPEYNFEPLITVVEDGFGRRVVGPNYEMRFHGGEELELHLPDSLLISQGGAQIETLAQGPTDCGLERQVGFALFPAVVATSDTDGTVLESSITTNDDGPFVAQINTRFVVEYNCPTPHQLTASSTFTFFPTGRIVRNDSEVKAIESGALTSAGGECGCVAAFPATDTFFFTSFWAFADTGRNVDHTNVEIIGQGQDEMGACTLYATHGVGVQYNPVISRVAPNANADAHVLDFQTGSTITDTAEQAFSAIQIDGDDDLVAAQCSTLLQKLSEPAIRVGDEELGSANESGIYDDFQPHEDEFDVEVIGNEVVPPGWALAVDLASDIVRITRDPPSVNSDEPVARIQRFEQGGSRFLLLFTDSLEPGVTITIEPL